jgi:hypothetical protein
MASDLPNHLLEDIFLHLEDAADLARASAACASFRRVVSNDRFLRRFRSRHRRPVLGLLENQGGGKIGFYPVQSPRRSALAAGACAETTDFTFGFIPGPKCCWRVRDARDGRVLLSRYKRLWHALNRRPPLLVVCDPLHRRHVEIPPIPDDLLDAAASTEHGGAPDLLEFEPFFAPAPAADEEVDELSFLVICNALSVTKLVAFTFSSASGQWRAVVSFSNPNYVLKNLCSLWFRQPAHGLFYWTNFSETFMLVLDTREMQFFVISDIPHKSYGQSKLVVEAAGEGRLGLLLLLEDKLELYSRAWQGNNGGVVVPEPADQEWRHDKTIPMFAGLWNLSGTANGYAFLRWLPRDHVELWAEAHYFTVDLKTLLVERLCVLEFSNVSKFLYASFPPPLSPPTV